MTAQVNERLILDGERTSMAFCPPIPDSPEILTRLTDEEFYEKMSSGKINNIINSTACWRGYIGTWEIKDGKFYLKEIEGAVRLAQNAPILATWFTGVLRIPQGKQLHYVHMGFGSIYERDLFIKIQEGIVVEQKVVDNTEKAMNAENQSPEERFMEGLRNLPGMEKLFEKYGD